MCVLTIIVVTSRFLKIQFKDKRDSFMLFLKIPSSITDDKYVGLAKQAKAKITSPYFTDGIRCFLFLTWSHPSTFAQLRTSSLFFSY